MPVLSTAMGSIASFAILIPLAVCEVSFDEHLQRFGKSYTGEEYEQRKAIFQQTAAKVEALNAQPGRLWTAGLNQLSDLLPEELAQQRGYDKMLREGQAAHLGAMSSAVSMAALVAKDLPASVDWRSHSPPVVTPVKSQGACGSCWAFAAAETIESHVALNTGVLMSLSPQQATSCAPNPNKCGGSGGCTGATAQLAFNYTIEAGISSIWTSPYESGTTRSTGQCESYYTPVAGITGYETLPANDADALAEAVATLGPISVSVDASKWNMYAGGIFDDCNKTNPDINHAVQLVGYGAENGTKYWLVRNSWGAFWGEDGYIRLKRHDVELCGTDVTPEHGFGCEGGPSEMRVCGECGILSDSSYPKGAFVNKGWRRLQGDAAVSASGVAGEVAAQVVTPVHV